MLCSCLPKQVFFVGRWLKRRILTSWTSARTPGMTRCLIVPVHPAGPTIQILSHIHHEPTLFAAAAITRHPEIDAQTNTHHSSPTRHDAPWCRTKNPRTLITPAQELIRLFDMQVEGCKRGKAPDHKSAKKRQQAKLRAEEQVLFSPDVLLCCFSLLLLLCCKHSKAPHQPASHNLRKHPPIARLATARRDGWTMSPPSGTLPSRPGLRSVTMAVRSRPSRRSRSRRPPRTRRQVARCGRQVGVRPVPQLAGCRWSRRHRQQPTKLPPPQCTKLKPTRTHNSNSRRQ